MPCAVDSISLLYTGPDWLLLEKPNGIGMHCDHGNDGFMVAASRQFAMRLWPVHRLDKDTSGLILVATTASAAARLSALFAERRIEKYYLAQSHYKPNKKQGWIKGDMTKTRNGCWKLQRSQEQPAITRFISQTTLSENGTIRQFLLAPKTGKTHQLRVALKSMAAPIDGDTRYGGQLSDRLYLHAYALRFTDQSHTYEFVHPPTVGVHWHILPSEWQEPWQRLSL
ncbi:MAG: TIGR01621 family pseudouridine synthase [Bacterioplanes sp.]|nr:TIGR01621 family pseudouridine synthase [Bacterioplanes sp.]